MVGDTISFNRKTTNLQREQVMSQAELIQKLSDLCITAGLSMGSTPPVAVSPGVWMFYAVECSKFGHCRQQPRYAAMMGDRLIFT